MTQDFNDELETTFHVSNDPAYMAVLDVTTYDKDLPEWNYRTLTERITGEMNAGHIVAWGCPENSSRVRVVRRPLTSDEQKLVHASVSGLLSTSGVLCIASYTDLTMCAQFAHETFPQNPEDELCVPAGTYRADVHQLFPHQPGEQFAEIPDDRELHYLVVLTALPAGDWKPPPISWVPWALRA